ncbi:hypothetical protein TL16_g01604 [Triparma laevis f. inornata]|uniref:Dihydroorotate dehydrogenase catalytic domain-containing protein n=1 Tax=Triparma laevis f. inornata TaxID=1714386 RepID=A0A9W6ZQD8_9STRA|nr:hypothetical protein TL16_g01604 [Triparma laevis f. inornata]
MLPFESEALREVVWWRYVGSAEGQAKWHAHIIVFFMEQRPSLRRCEELPWHLRKCRKWTTLRNVLVDLRTFDVMYNGEQIKGGLFSYWRALVRGPLYMSDEIEASIVLQSSNPHEPELLAEFSSRVYNASGPRTGSSDALQKVGASKSSAILTKSATLLPQTGNPLPRTYTSPTFSINSEGLPNKSIEYYIDGETIRESVGETGKPYFVSISGKSLEDNVEMMKLICKG